MEWRRGSPGHAALKAPRGGDDAAVWPESLQSARLHLCPESDSDCQPLETFQAGCNVRLSSLFLAMSTRSSPRFN